MIPIPFLVLHLIQAFGMEKGLVNLLTKQKSCVFFNFLTFLRSIKL